jgi:hypothetical protein
MTSSSASSPARRALEEFVAGRLPADRLVAAVAQRFYGAAGQGERDALRPVVEVAERAAPGVVSLERKDGGAGFDIRPLERPFPSEYEEALRGAATAALAASWKDSERAAPRAVPAPTPAPAARSPIPEPRSPTPQSWFGRVVNAVRRLFSA